MHSSSSIPRPIVLSIAAHDPTGGAGTQADTESIIANGCQPISIITALTAQSLEDGVQSMIPQNPEHFAYQLDSVLEQFTIAAIKIGVIGSEQILQQLIKALEKTPSVPIIFDPVLSSSSGFNFCDANTFKIFQQQLIPRCMLITPNKSEASQLTQQNDTQQAASELLKHGCGNILITSVIDNLIEVEHQLFTEDTHLQYQYPKLSGEYHGSGCTLSAAIAAQIALGQPIEQAVKTSLDFTWHSLNNAIIQQKNQYIPNRFYKNQ